MSVKQSASPGPTEEVDVIVVGSGCAGLVSALTARSAGLDVVIIEKCAVLGGTTAISGGGAWVPNAPAVRRSGGRHDTESAIEYLKNISDGLVTEERIERYVEAAPLMMEFLESLGPHLREKFFWAPECPDYFPALGGSAKGSGVWPVPIDRRLLGEDEKLIRAGWQRLKGLPRGMWVTAADMHEIVGIRWKSSGLRPYVALSRLAWRAVKSRLTGQRIAANGAALVGRLLLAVRKSGIPLRLNTPMAGLVTNDEGRVIGVEIETSGRKEVLRARKGVILATGGFENNPEMRSHYQPLVGHGWSVASPDNTGDGQRAARDIGAKLELMDEAWWYPLISLPQGLSGGTMERKSPGQFIVNGAGQRFANECAPYTELGKIQIVEHAKGVQHIPAWMIIDEKTWRTNIFCGNFPGSAFPSEWLESGHAYRAETIAELARKIGVPEDALVSTTERFNGFAREGRDHDFGRGGNVYDNYLGNPKLKNPNLAEVKHPPFYAFKIYPSDLGTKGGVLTDEDARVLNEKGEPIPGLYAAGNVTASMMGTRYSGTGATIGPAMTFGWLAARHIAAQP